MTFSRESPSPRYTELLEQYRAMHKAKQFSGIGAYKHRRALRRLIRETNAKVLLDFGCGRGLQFASHNAEALLSKLNVFCSSWTEALGVERIVGYDPASEAYSIVPTGKFDGVYAIDVLEHCNETDLPWIIEEIFSYAFKFVFLTVAIVPAKKNLPNGENAHVTLKSQDWWLGLIDEVAKEHPGIRYEVELEEEVLKSQTDKE